MGKTITIISETGTIREIHDPEPGQIIYLEPGERVLTNNDGLPDCSEPNYEKWPNNINAMLADIKRYRRQKLDPVGYREELRAIEIKAGLKKIKGAPKL